MLSIPVAEVLARRASALALLLAALAPFTAQAAPSLARTPTAHRYSVLNDGGRAMTVTVAPVVVQRASAGRPPRMRIVDGGQLLTRHWRGAGVYRPAASKRSGSTPTPGAWSVSLNYD